MYKVVGLGTSHTEISTQQGAGNGMQVGKSINIRLKLGLKLGS